VQTSQVAGLVDWVVSDGFAVGTLDGAGGVEWGHDQLWPRGQEVDGVVTVAAHHASQPSGDLDACRADARVEEIVTWTELDATESRSLDEFRWRRLEGPDSLSAAESARADALAARDVEVALFLGDRLCGRRDHAEG
jgi:hypothetical protein